MECQSFLSNFVEIIHCNDIMVINVIITKVLQMNRIRELRRHMKLTQKELAKHLQIADSTLSYWEMGKYEPDREALMKLSRFFKVPIDYILGGDFAKWYVDDDGTLNPNADLPRSGESDMFVSEHMVEYNHQNGQSAFDRIEFKDLTQGEIDLLAEYALFIKSRRKSES